MRVYNALCLWLIVISGSMVKQLEGLTKPMAAFVNGNREFNCARGEMTRSIVLPTAMAQPSILMSALFCVPWILSQHSFFPHSYVVRDRHIPSAKQRILVGSFGNRYEDRMAQQGAAYPLRSQLPPNERAIVIRIENEKLPKLRKILKVLEELAHDLGLDFFWKLVDCREEILVVDPSLERLFDLFLADTNANLSAEIVAQIEWIRNCMDQVRRDAHRNNTETAREVFNRANQTLRSLKENILTAIDLLKAWDDAHRATWGNYVFPDQGLPEFTEDLSVPPGFETKSEEIQRWVENLPENKAARAMGLKTLQEQVRQYREEDRILDDYDLDFSSISDVEPEGAANADAGDGDEDDDKENDDAEVEDS